MGSYLWRRQRRLRMDTNRVDNEQREAAENGKCRVLHGHIRGADATKSGYCISVEKDMQSDELEAEQRGLFLAQLKSAGWYSGSRRGSLATSRAGITWEIAPLRGSEGRWELRFSDHTDTTHAEGDVTLPPDADQAALADAMTGGRVRPDG